ncbi:MAG: hypothetical protein KDB37_19280, partial [Ilumatobacter sp.]|nr:hypothetical protein [Ilumatobacter sp.]
PVAVEGVQTPAGTNYVELYVDEAFVGDDELAVDVEQGWRNAVHLTFAGHGPDRVTVRLPVSAITLLNMLHAAVWPHEEEEDGTSTDR